MSFFQMKGISISAAHSLSNKSGNLTWKASEIQSTESLNLDTLVEGGSGVQGVVWGRSLHRYSAVCFSMYY